MKIGIVELAVHAETVDALCQMLATTRAEVTLWVGGSVWQALRHQPYVPLMEWRVQPDHQRGTDFLEAQIAALDACDVVIFNTIQRHLRAYTRLRLRTKKIVRIHNAYFMFKSPDFTALVLPQPLGLWQFRLKQVLRDRDWLHCGALLQWADAVAFPDSAIHDHALQNHLVPPAKVFPAIYTTVSPATAPSPPPATAPFTVTITGEVSLDRKDYALVAQAFTLLLPRLPRPVRLVLLGKQGKAKADAQVVAQLRALQSPHFTLVAYAGRVPQAYFDVMLSQTHLLLAPIKPTFRTATSVERYGYSKISGSVADLIKYQKPALFPVFYPIAPAIQPAVATFTDAPSLAQALLDALNHLPDIACLRTAFHAPTLGAALIEAITKWIKEAPSV